HAPPPRLTPAREPVGTRMLEMRLGIARTRHDPSAGLAHQLGGVDVRARLAVGAGQDHPEGGGSHAPPAPAEAPHSHRQRPCTRPSRVCNRNVTAQVVRACRYQKLVRRIAVEHDALAGGESPACSTSFAACSVPSALPCGCTEPSPSKTLPCGISSQCSSEEPKDGPDWTPADRLLWVWLARSWREWRQGLSS